MVFTDIGKSGTMMLLGPSGGSYPKYITLDAGSQTVNVSTSGLNSAVLQREITQFNQTVNKQITDAINYNSLELSGLAIYGFGLKELDGVSGVEWQVINWVQTGSIGFDGNKELQIQTTLKFI